ncbi:cytoplasmic dynein 2 intermediate chain 1-like isoform X2 [Amphibalanus amphitrite]|uniref:cytoplasmic dynein 2 intermediate chain 1-like isoform X2 n=1 Tax=Amphibalanus amphitrite TaxID=1232801 RepID=UPI001C9021C1|nr:cytoplasmic dynein 2 intermediate chain 1-like isoform X2 [Amphibalanus amphitrite]XP_043234220.1 cytoplasmic dynein 2 intermediate chain 1-like isoform X2 [Amphibalanus amphitrite]XP_043234229.1 cytoplasmic dynein 2 intermediate chain 1-like isoform X2 [Amphibalanus amphitrite]
MNKKEGSKMKGESRTKVKPDKAKEQKKSDVKGKGKAEEPKKSTKDTQKRAGRSPSKADTKEKAKTSVTKDERTGKPRTDVKKVKKTGSEHHKSSTKDSKSSLKSKKAPEEPAKASKDHKAQPSKADANASKKTEQSKKSAKTDGSHVKKSSKPETSPKKASPNKAHVADAAPKENGDHKAKKSSEPISPKKAKAPTPEPPPRKTPTPKYEDDFEVLSPANNPNTHSKRLATAVPRKQFQPPADTYAKQDWEPDQLKKAIDSENKRAETFDAEEFHKQKKARAPPPPPAEQKRRPSVPVTFAAEVAQPAAEPAGGAQPSRSVDFSHAKKEQQRRKSAQKRQGRGRALLSLIELFEQDFDLFEMEPASYDQIVANFGKSGLQQGTSQTNEDDLAEEVQTDEVVCRHKWTQHPIQFDVRVTTNAEGEVVTGPTYYDYLGVGGDMEEDERDRQDRLHSSAIRLNRFLGAAGSCILMLLEEGAARSDSGQAGGAAAGRLSFSSAAARLGGGVADLLAGRPATFVSFSDSDGRLLVSAHAARPADPQQAKGASDPEQPESADRCGLVCVWSVSEPSRPQKVLITSAEPVCCCFSPLKPRLAFAGSANGSVDVWDLHESGAEQSGARQSAAGAPLRSPTYSTAEIHRGGAHTERLVALRPVPAAAAGQSGGDTEPGAIQVCSLDAAGRLVFWVAISSRQRNNLEVLDGDLGLAPWGKVKLVKISHVSVDDFLDTNQQGMFTEASDFRIDPSDPSHIYVSTDTGVIVHCTRQGGRPVPRLFRPDTDVSVPARCLALCPFEQPFLLAGGADGSLRLHTTTGERPLITWNAAADAAPVLALHWSQHRPCVFFVLDADSRIHVWDLSAGDIFPAETDQVQSGPVTAMDLSYSADGDSRVTHLAVSTADGALEVHTVAETYTHSQAGELDQFLHYVRII